jgi:hypothetical protein
MGSLGDLRQSLRHPTEWFVVADAKVLGFDRAPQQFGITGVGRLDGKATQQQR